MARYQIRIPPNIMIDEIIFTMAARAKDALQACYLYDCRPTVEDWTRAAKATADYAKLYVKLYKLCGISSVCMDASKTRPWAFESQRLDPTPQDIVYQLLPRTTLEEFLRDLVHRFYGSLEPLLKQNCKVEVLSMLTPLFKSALADYLYYNPLCGHTELCTFSPVAVSTPWWHRISGLSGKSA